jgi:branched-chain amino acid transport system ATP-binding protein
MTLLLRDVCVGYGQADVVRNVAIQVGQGEITAFVGSNGAGKSTIVRAIAGVIGISGGAIEFDGHPIHDLSVTQRVRRGIVLVPEGRQIFAGLTVRENLMLGAYSGPASDNTGRADELVNFFPALRPRLLEPAGNLSGGQQQMLAIARGLMSRPKLLMLDEPSLGLAPRLVDEVFDLIKNLKAQGLSILISEQNARASLRISDRGYVIENGRIVLSGAGKDLVDSTEIAERYLGTGKDMADSGQGVRTLTRRLSGVLQKASS